MAVGMHQQGLSLGWPSAWLSWLFTQVLVLVLVMWSALHDVLQDAGFMQQQLHRSAPGHPAAAGCTENPAGSPQEQQVGNDGAACV